MCEKGKTPRKETEMYTEAELDRIANEPLNELEKDIMDGYAPVDDIEWLRKRVAERKKKAAEAELKKGAK